MTTLEPSIIRIFHSNGSAAGTGFLVAPDLALTCAHVISAALMGTLAPPEQAP